MRELIEQASDGIVIADPEGRLTDVNPAACAMFGYPREELLGSPISRVVPKAQGDPDGRRCGARTVEWTAARPDGTTVPLEANATRLHDGRCQAFVRDVTVRKHAERERAEATHRLMTVLEQCPVGILVVISPQYGSEGSPSVLTNLRTRKLFGRTLDPQRGVEQFAEQLLQPDGARLDVSDFPSQRALRGEMVAAKELLLVGGDGRHTPIACTSVALTDADGEAHGAVVVVEDISAMKERERLRAEWNSLVAHDLRQPLHSIAVRTGFLARTAPELEEPLRQISLAVARLNRMVQDLLDLSQLEVRRMDFQRRAVNLTRVVRQAAVHTLSDTEDRPLYVNAPAEPLPVHADPDRLAQVVENLVSNAIKYGEAGTPVEIVVMPLGETIAVDVTNAGEGIPADLLPRIFDRFYRVEEGKRLGIKGTGLGLYIAREIVEAHGGALTVTCDAAAASTTCDAAASTTCDAAASTTCDAAASTTCDAAASTASVPGARTTFRITLPRASR